MNSIFRESFVDCEIKSRYYKGRFRAQIAFTTIVCLSKRQIKPIKVDFTPWDPISNKQQKHVYRPYTLSGTPSFTDSNVNTDCSRHGVVPFIYHYNKVILFLKVYSSEKHPRPYINWLHLLQHELWSTPVREVKARWPRRGDEQWRWMTLPLLHPRVDYNLRYITWVCDLWGN